MFKIFALFITSSIILTACEPTLEDLIKNKDLRRKILTECKNKGFESKNDERCKLAMQAEVKAASNIIGNLFK